MSLRLCAPCLFGLEGVVGEELRHLGYTGVAPETGRVYFTGEAGTLAEANIRLRCAERVLITLGQFPAPTFDALFEGVTALPWEEFLPRDGAFPVKGHSLQSALTSLPDCQKIIKKAVADRLGRVYGLSWLPEDGVRHQIQFALHRDVATLYLDTTGVGLHKRGYRPTAGEAPLRETLAAAVSLLLSYKGRGPFCDPFCGAGTLPIEAALIARNRAPGLLRQFDAMAWPMLPRDIWKQAREAAQAAEFSRTYDLWGGDRDAAVLQVAQASARRAGVADDIRFVCADATQFTHEAARGTLVANPPYGERLLDKREAAALARAFGRAAAKLNGCRVGVLTADAEYERHFGRPAKKRRKLYNGMIPCALYTFETEVTP